MTLSLNKSFLVFIDFLSFICSSNLSLIRFRLYTLILRHVFNIFLFQIKFDIDPNSKRMVLSSMGCSWRAFKTNLTRLWIRPLRHQRELLKHPPPKYEKFISPDVWTEFVCSRLTKGFEV